MQVYIIHIVTLVKIFGKVFSIASRREALAEKI